MNIVYLNPVGALGGGERSLLDVMASVRQADPLARLSLVACTDGPLLDHARRLGVRVLLLPMPEALVELGDSGWKGRPPLDTFITLARRGPAAAWTTWCYARRLRRAIRGLQPDIVHSNGIKCHLLTRLAGTATAPVLWHIRDFLSTRPLMARALRWASARACAGIAISQAVGADARTVLRRLPVEPIYNAVDTEHFAPGPGDGPQLDRLAGLESAGPDAIRIGLVATFARWKGHEVFLEAAARVWHGQPSTPIRFYIIGGPIYRTHGAQVSDAELRAKAAALGIAKQVGFIGFQENTADVYRALDIVVHASTQPEPFGRTIVEAMACARPVIVSQAGGAAELFTHGHDALGVPPGDATALASAILPLIRDRGARQRIAAHARRTAVERFSRERLGRQILSTYRRILTPTPRAAA
ncbi:MAG TPA: glycosyltransferase family 4 protein [Gemmataceae bacterium]|nr:glycosyltransferase family 4 protein [Gemmataceae bacterium]